MEKEPVVSIICEVYNHENYLRECLEGFVNQKTTFPIEILIHDDASTDNSALIIEEYEKKYPSIIKPIYQKVNQYSQGISIWQTYQFPRAKGKYIALCEGDDYWTDPYKLQKQVDILETHPEYVLCTHKYQEFLQTENKKRNILPEEISSDLIYDSEFFIQRKQWVTQPLTTVFRKSAFDLQYYRQYKNSKDVALYYYLLKSGKGILLKDCMAVYRIHSGGIWSGADNPKRYNAELRTYLGICEVERDSKSVKALAVRVRDFGYLGFRFFSRYSRVYFQIMKIIYKEYGFRYTFSLFLRSINYFHSYF